MHALQCQKLESSVISKFLLFGYIAIQCHISEIILHEKTRYLSEVFIDSNFLVANSFEIMDKASKALRRSGVRIRSIGSGHSDLQMVIAQLKDVRTTGKVRAQ